MKYKFSRTGVYCVTINTEIKIIKSDKSELLTGDITAKLIRLNSYRMHDYEVLDSTVFKLKNTDNVAFILNLDAEIIGEKDNSVELELMITNNLNKSIACYSGIPLLRFAGEEKKQ